MFFNDKASRVLRDFFDADDVKIYKLESSNGYRVSISFDINARDILGRQLPDAFFKALKARMTRRFNEQQAGPSGEDTFYAVPRDSGVLIE